MTTWKSTIIGLWPILRHRINKRGFTLRFTLACISFAVFSAAACGSSDVDSGQNDRELLVVTTLYPLEYFTTRVGGDLVDVVNLVGPGVEAHDFEPLTGDMRLMSKADLVIYNGLGFEPWMDRAISSLDDPEIAVVELGLALAERSEVSDPHFWLDPLLAREQVLAIDETLSTVAPSHATEFRQNAESALADLDALHDEFVAGLDGCGLSTFVTSHAAFGHLAARYALVQVSVSGLTPEAEPSPAKLAQLTQDIKSTGVKYVMSETMSTRGLPETIAAEIDVEVLKLHPLESLTPNQASEGDTYLDIMRENLTSLRTALECP